MVIYCLDTSGLNRLFDDPDREPIVNALLAAGSFRISAYNVIEAAKTTSELRRVGLVDFMRRLANGKRPLDRPNTILLSYASAHAQGARLASVNADEKLDGLWVALTEPHLIDEEARQEVISWAAQWEEDFSDLVTADRAAFQNLFLRSPDQQPRTAAATLRAYLERKTECRSLVSDIYKRHTGQSLATPGYDVLTREPAWPLYLAGYAYAIHRRAIQQQNFSTRKNAGAIDVGQAVYLTLCDQFVTDDHAQYQALRLLNVLNTKRDTQVLEYASFRHRLLPFG